VRRFSLLTVKQRHKLAPVVAPIGARTTGRTTDSAIPHMSKSPNGYVIGVRRQRRLRTHLHGLQVRRRGAGSRGGEVDIQSVAGETRPAPLKTLSGNSVRKTRQACPRSARRRPDEWCRLRSGVLGDHEKQHTIRRNQESPQGGTSDRAGSPEHVNFAGEHADSTTAQVLGARPAASNASTSDIPTASEVVRMAAFISRSMRSSTSRLGCPNRQPMAQQGNRGAHALELQAR